MMKKIWYLFLIISFFSCKEENKNQTSQATTIKKFAAPIVLIPGKDTIKLPVTITLSEVEKPKVTQVRTPVVRSNKTGNLNSPEGTSHFTNFSSNDGLSLDVINSSIIDKIGNIWFATAGRGVNKYDGKTFKNYSTAQGLANNFVSSIIEDKDGIIWFGTHGGLSSYDGKTFKNYTTTQKLANNFITSIAEDKIGNLWFGTYGGGLSKYDGITFKNYKSIQGGLASNYITSIAEDKKGNLWFGTFGGGVSKYSGKTFKNYTTANGLANNVIMSILEDKRGNLWFGTYGGGVSLYDGETFTNYTTTQGLANNIIMCIVEDKPGNIWFGTYGGGVSIFDGKTFKNYTINQGLANNFIMSITQDRMGNLWLSTIGSGICRYDGKTFTNYITSKGLADNFVVSITQDKKGNLWFGNSGCGVRKYNGKEYTNFTTAQGLANNGVRSIIEDKTGTLWFGTDGGGVSRYDGKTFKNYTTTQGLSNNKVWCIIEDNIGCIWFGTDGGGVSRYDGKTFTNFTTAQGLTNNSIWCGIKDKTGNLWFGTDGGGVSRYNGKTFTNYTTAQGLSNNGIWSITEDKRGNLWFGTNGGGISRYDGKTFANFTTAHGLPDDVVTQAVADQNGSNMVIATNFGIAVGTSFTLKPSISNVKGLPYKKQIPFQNNLTNHDLLTFYDLVLETYNSATEYPIKDVNVGQNCMMQDNKGIYWAGTGSAATALVRIDFKELKSNPKVTTPILYNIKLNEENICYYSLDSKSNNQDSNIDSTTLSQQEINTYGRSLKYEERDSIQKKYSGIEFNGIAKFYPIPQNLVIPYEHNNVTFEFNAVQLSRSHLLNFQYMLEGYDKTWSPVLKKREATFGNINEGTYTFKLKAQYTGPDGNNAWSEVLTYRFTVLPPWYRTWWMYTLYTLTLIGIVYLLIKQQTKKLKQRQKELEQKIDIATEDIREQKHIIEEKHKEITDSINYAERIQRSFLATKELLDENLASTGSVTNSYFVYFKPKDVVSGDFYWASKLSNDNFVLVTADSTGHGVPGAIMSLLNITSIESAIKDGFLQPSDILNVTRKTIIERLKKDGSAEGGKDGMDCSLISFDFKNKKLLYAAANNPVWIIRDKTLIELEADRMPIGKHDKDSISFTQHEFDLQLGDMIYTLTDGFPDQFGGPKGKKFMYKQLENLLISISHESMEIQKQKLEDVFENWKGDLEQVDDVCVIGVKV